MELPLSSHPPNGSNSWYSAYIGTNYEYNADNGASSDYNAYIGTNYEYSADNGASS